MGMPSKRQWKWILMVILAALTLIVIFQNTESVETKVLFVTFHMPRVALLFITFVVGVILGVWGDRYLLRK